MMGRSYPHQPVFPPYLLQPGVTQIAGRHLNGNAAARRHRFRVEPFSKKGYTGSFRQAAHKILIAVARRSPQAEVAMPHGVVPAC